MKIPDTGRKRVRSAVVSAQGPPRTEASLPACAGARLRWGTSVRSTDPSLPSGLHSSGGHRSSDCLFDKC